MQGELVWRIADKAITLGPAAIELVKAIVEIIHAPKPSSPGDVTVDEVRAQIADAQSVAQAIADTASRELAE